MRPVTGFIHANQNSHAGSIMDRSTASTTLPKCYANSMKIIKAKALPAFRLELQFDNGESGVVDLSEFVGRGVFTAWEKLGTFEQVSVTVEGAIEWPGEIDMCPDSLYLRMTGKRPEDIFPVLQNRLSHA